MCGTNPSELNAEFSITRRLKVVKKPVWHCPLSLPPGEKITAEKWREIAEDFIRTMGFSEETPWVAVQHKDKKHDHVHLIVSKVDYKGLLWKDSFDVFRAGKATSDLEKKYGLIKTKTMFEKQDIKRLTGAEIKRAERTHEEQPREKLQRLVGEAANGKKSVVDFVAELESQGVSVRPNLAKTGTLNGFSFIVDEIPFKGSQLGEKFKWQNLQKSGVEYVKERDQAALQAHLVGEKIATEHVRAAADQRMRRPDDDLAAAKAVLEAEARRRAEYEKAKAQAEAQKAVEDARWGSDEAEALRNELICIKYYERESVLHRIWREAAPEKFLTDWQEAKQAREKAEEDVKIRRERASEDATGGWARQKMVWFRLAGLDKLEAKIPALRDAEKLAYKTLEAAAHAAFPAELKRFLSWTRETLELAKKADEVLQKWNEQPERPAESEAVQERDRELVRRREFALGKQFNVAWDKSRSKNPSEAAQGQKDLEPILK